MCVRGKRDNNDESFLCNHLLIYRRRFKSNARMERPPTDLCAFNIIHVVIVALSEAGAGNGIGEKGN